MKKYFFCSLIAALVLGLVMAGNVMAGYTFDFSFGVKIRSGDGQFSNPFGGVALDSSGNIFVADTYNHRIQKFDSAGNYLSQFGSQGSGEGASCSPIGEASESAGNINVMDKDNHRIQKFDSAGNYLSQFGSPGTGDGQFDDPSGVTLDS